MSLAERLLTLPLRLRDLVAVADLVPALARELEEELAARATVRWQDDESPYPSRPAPGRQLLEVRERAEVIAHLELERSPPFSGEELRLLEHLAAGLEEHLTEMSERAEMRLQAELSSVLAAGEDLEDAARLAVTSLSAHLGPEAVLLALDANSELRVLATAGDWAPGPEPKRRDAILREALRSDGPLTFPDGLLACPVGARRPVRYALLLRFRPDLPGTATRAAAVRQAGRIVRPHLDAQRYTQALQELLELHEASEDVPARELYERALATAIRLVPGADGGSLLVRRNKQEPFTFQAVSPWELEQVERFRLPASELRAWYGKDATGWRRGRARIVRGDVHDIASLVVAASPQLESAIDRFGGMQATLCLPVLHDGDVLAVLNLENLHDPGAFGRDSLDVCQLLGPTLASLLHRNHVRDILMNAALTDELTGLKNRRAFDDALVRELARRERAGNEMSVLLMDLTGFKEVNDTLGHEAGDQALIEVADALRSVVRQTDVIGRWGGDEFAAILIDTPAAEAAETAERIRRAVSAIRFGGVQLGIDVGTATAPGEGTDAAELLALADGRMYQDKRK